MVFLSRGVAPQRLKKNKKNICEKQKEVVGLQPAKRGKQKRHVHRHIELTANKRELITLN